jgi:hypothetical protein
MVEKLLTPMDETMNDHKRMQLRELAALNGELLACALGTQAWEPAWAGVHC